MMRDILSRLGELTLRLLRWYADRVIVSWRRELRNIGSRDNKWVWIVLCIFFSFFLLPYLTKEAFSDSFLLGLSFIWSALLAISFAYILRNPLVMILVYVGVVFGREVMTIFTAAKEEATSGNIIGAVIVFALGVYLITWANRIKRGEV
jgi:4-hydroxybenzoate polyprenyltransferase